MRYFNQNNVDGKFVRRIAILVTMAFSVTLLIAIIRSGLLPLKYTLSIFVGLVVLNVSIALLFLRTERKSRIIFGSIIALFTTALSICGLYGVYSGLTLLSNINDNTSVQKKKIDNTKPFNIYISGIDTYGDITAVSRSDVNIVATINPTKKHILLTSVRRDSYVPIAGGGNNQYDKLTHAGNYGVDSSMQTIANLLDTKIDNYVRINFTSFMDLINAIDGVTVNNPVEFTADGGRTFKQGSLDLDGESALTFARERYGLAGGDGDRGKNQERVVAAVINKLASPSILHHYQDVLNIVGSSIQTNIPSDSITALINQQINDSGSWLIESTDIEGTGQTGGLPSYAMPNSQLYMFVINQASLQQVKERIKSGLTSV